MSVRRKFYTIRQLAKKWKFITIDIKNFIISGELKASIFNDEGTLVTYDKFTDIPNDLREYLKVIRSDHGIPNKYNKTLRAWDKLIITAEEVFRYASNNNETDTPDVGKTLSTDTSPRIDKTLLTLIAYLLEVISGEFSNIAVEKHQSIKNQTDLITKLTELEVFGLSKTNLENYFSMANKTIKNPVENSIIKNS